MTDATCLHCGRHYDRQHARRRWCYVCLPAYDHGSDPRYGVTAAALHDFAKTGRHTQGCCPCLPIRDVGKPVALTVRPTGTCRLCHRRFRDDSRGRRMYCSLDCRYKAAREGLSPRRGRPPERLCLWCHQPFRPAKFDPRISTCSRDCRFAMQTHLTVEPRSDCCTLGTCRVCGDSIYGDRRYRRGGYCKECAKVVAADRSKNQSRNKAHRRRTTSKAGENIDTQTLGERDGWVCHLCGGPVDGSLSGKDPAGPTQDHLVPMSAGGTHTWDNVALAHRACNVARGTGGTAQLRLIG